MPESTDQNAGSRSDECFEALLQSLDDTSSTGRKQKKSNPLDPYLTAARFFRLNYDLFANIFVILRDGILAEFEPEDADHNQEQNEETQANIHLFTTFAKSIPNLSNLITKLEREPESLTSFLKSMESAANAARCDDTGSLKHAGLQYMLDDPAKDRFDPLILKSHNVAEFDMDPQAYMDKVNAGEKKISAKQWPSMFYDMSMYDPKNKKKGFLRSRVVIQAWRHIFTGPMSALSKEHIGRSSKPGKGKMHHLAEPGIRNIMYAACQMYFTASNAESWTPVIGAMDLGDLYYRAVDIIQDSADQQWVKDLMKFWKDETPGLTDNRPSKRCRVATANDSGTDDDMDDFFGDDTATTEQDDQETETHRAQLTNNGESLNQAATAQNGGPHTPPPSSPAPSRIGSPAVPEREQSPLSDPPTSPSASVGRNTKQVARVP
ncbi:hypothetical protein EDD22DRAFT_955715 [Suillus occidentalis]|nr:hypothetical protein EDD22DRAFT_955715 [Suillus occidentalis]